MGIDLGVRKQTLNEISQSEIKENVNQLIVQNDSVKEIVRGKQLTMVYTLETKY